MENAIATYDIEAVKKLVNEATTNDDNVGKDVVNALFEKNVRAKAMVMVKSNATIEEIEELFLFVIKAAQSDLCAKNLSVIVIQDLLECSKKSRCADIFTIVENHIAIWKTPEFFEQCKNNVLRMCNDLLKRLSRTIDTQFCGRINILLARSLPLNEKSGLNPTGQFNATNETEYDMEIDETELKTGAKEQSEDIDIEATPEIPVDFKLYQQFWELQKYFSDPNTIYQKGEFDTFQRNLNEVLIIFTSYKLDKRRGTNHHNQADNNAMEGIEESYKRPDVFFAKYQTSQKLLHLQFADPQFRRYFLVQCLILSNYLQSDVRFRDDTYFLTEEQNKFVSDMSDKCYKLLRDTFPRGYYFSEFVKKLLSREKVWSTWKNEGCSDWLANKPERVIKSVRRQPLPTYDPQKIDLGIEVLNRLWSLSADNLSACKDPKRNFVPKIEDVVIDALDHADPEQGVEAEYSCFNNEVWQWKSSRLFLTEGDSYLSIQSTPAARKPCIEYSEVLKKGVFNIAMHSKDSAMREKGLNISQRAEEFRVKQEEEAKKAEEEARQKAEEEAKRKAMEAAAERKKKDEESAAQRAKELAEMTAKKPTKKEDRSRSPSKEHHEPSENSTKKSIKNGDRSRSRSKERREPVETSVKKPAKNEDASPSRTIKERRETLENSTKKPVKPEDSSRSRSKERRELPESTKKIVKTEDSTVSKERRDKDRTPRHRERDHPRQRDTDRIIKQRRRSRSRSPHRRSQKV